MIYYYNFTIPPRTHPTEPVTLDMKPGVKTLKTVSVTFPSGCLGAVGIQLYDEHRQFAPLPAGWISDNNNTVSWVENRLLSGPSYRIMAVGYNMAVDWPHTLRIKLEVI